MKCVLTELVFFLLFFYDVTYTRLYCNNNGCTFACTSDYFIYLRFVGRKESVVKHLVVDVEKTYDMMVMACNNHNSSLRIELNGKLYVV